MATPLRKTLVDSTLLWGDSPLPAWAYDPRAIYDDEHSMFISYKMWSFVAWRFVFCANTILWCFWATFPIFTFATASCDGKGFAKTAPWTICIYMPVLAISLYLEYSAHRLLLPGLVDQLGPYKIIGCTVPFGIFFVVQLAVSCAAHMDLATSGIYLGRIIRTSFCEDSWVITIWKDVVAQSTAPWLPSLAVISSILWLAMISQLLLAMYHGFPLKNSDDEEVSTRREIFATTKPPNEFCLIATLGSQKVTGNSALQCFAESSRMNMLTVRNTDKILVGRKLLLQRGDRNTVLAMERDINRLSMRVVTTLFLETGTQPNLQASALAVQYAATREMDPLTLLSVLLGMAMGLYNLYAAFVAFTKMRKLLWPYVDAQEKRALMKSKVIFAVAAAFAVINILYALLKLFNAAFVCHWAVWNIDGCADMSSVMLAANETSS